MAFRQELQLRLGAVQPAFAAQTAGANGNFRLNNVIAGAQRVGFRIEEHHHALTLIVVHQEEPQDRNKGGDQHHGDTNQAPAEAG